MKGQDSNGQIGTAQIAGYKKDFASRPAFKVAMNAVTRGSLNEIALNRDVLNDVDMVFSDEIESGGPITDQKAASTCWLFADLNWLRIYTSKKKKIKGFEFSENFVMFWDKFEKANYFLEHMIDLRDRDLDDRRVNYLLSNPAGDGGEWNMMCNVIKKYGLVPKSVMQDTFNRENSRFLNDRLQYRLRMATAEIRRMNALGRSVAEMRKAKNAVMRDVYRILAIFLGEPPERFSWSYRDADKKYHAENGITPAEFYKKYVGMKPEDTFALLSCPMKGTPFDRAVQVEYFQNMWGGMEQVFANIRLEEMKKIALKILAKKEPVLFGCEVRQFVHSKEGILDTNLYDFDLMFDIEFDLDRGTRLEYQQGRMTHAMVFTGVDLVDGKPKKWKVENSWGDQFGKKGYFIMSDEWFDENVYELIVPRKFVPARVMKLFKLKPILLPPWHPLS